MKPLYYLAIPSILGTITIAGDDTFIRHIHLEGDRYFQAPPSTWIHRPHYALLTQVSRELTEYLSGARTSFDFPLASEGTVFQEKVWKALRAVPYGQTLSYSEIAKAIGAPKAVRAVGTAVGRNPLCIAIPCHRILTQSGALGGYVAGVARKEQLLMLEKNANSQ